MTLPARLLTRVIGLYQSLRAGRQSPCRFTPSCSAYAFDAVASYGALRGSWLSLRRLSRCHPWGGQGWDPVPEPAARRQPASDRTAA